MQRYRVVAGVLSHRVRLRQARNCNRPSLRSRSGGHGRRQDGSQEQSQVKQDPGDQWLHLWAESSERIVKPVVYAFLSSFCGSLTQRFAAVRGFERSSQLVKLDTSPA